jgi:hypothetical protein
MSKKAAGQGDGAGREAPKARPVRADAQRNSDALLEAALAVFTTSGVEDRKSTRLNSSHCFHPD